MKPPRFSSLDAVVFSGLSLAARAVYTAIHIKAAATGEWLDSQDELARLMQISRRHVQSAIAELSRDGHLFIQHGKTVNRYLLPWCESLHSAHRSAQSEPHSAQFSAHRSAQSGGDFNKVLKIKEPPTPFGEENTQTPGECPECFGTGYVLVRRVTRGQSHNEKIMCKCAVVKKLA